MPRRNRKARRTRHRRLRTEPEPQPTPNQLAAGLVRRGLASSAVLGPGSAPKGIRDEVSEA